MQNRNLWETKLGEYYTFLNNIGEVIQAIKDGKLNLNFQIKDRFTPGNNVDNYLAQVANDKNIILNYTDELHNVAITSTEILPVIINPVFFEKYKKDLKNAFIEKITSTNNGIILINDFVFSDELFEHLLNKSDVTLYFKNISLNDEQKEKLKSKFINAYYIFDNKKREQISSEYAFKNHTPKDLNQMSNLNIYLEDLEIEGFKNLCYLSDNAVIDISINNSNSIKNEEDSLILLKKRLLEIDNLNKPFTIKFNIKKRSNFNKIFKDTNFKNLSLVINNDSYDYPMEEYLEEEKKLNQLVEHIKNANLSPLEKYLAVYNICKNFKPYKENQNDLNSSRYLRYILDNEYIVCVGFAKLLIELLDKVGINALDISVDTDISYDSGFTLEEKVVELAGHARVIVSIDDDKYNIHGLYMADPTWDKNNLLNHSLMPFDKMQTSSRMFEYNLASPILDIHNFQEFNQQINFLLNHEIKKNKETSQSPFLKILLNSYKEVAKKVLTNIECDPRYQDFNILLTNCDTENDYVNFFTKLGNYLLTRINKPISNEIIITSLIEGMKKINPNLTNEEIKEFTIKIIEDNNKKELYSFPYTIPSESDFDLEDRKSL